MPITTVVEAQKVSLGSNTSHVVVVVEASDEGRRLVFRDQRGLPPVEVEAQSRDAAANARRAASSGGSAQKPSGVEKISMSM